jgi:hypothetical protein
MRVTVGLLIMQGISGLDKMFFSETATCLESPVAHKVGAFALALT